jgi:uncharacterized protein YdeI (YjbR/CyaY-like superfamily)
VSPRPDSAELLEVRDRAQLRAWFERNHDTSPGVRLAIGKKGNTVTALTYEDAVEEALSFGWIDSTANRLDADRYTVLLTRRKPRSIWARTNKARVERLIEAGLMTPAGMAAIERARADGSWNTLDDADDLRVPPDLADALAARPEAEHGFARLSPSKRRMALYWIGSTKRPETRAKRIAETVQAASEGRSPV